ncbi:MAG: DUF5752 family protein [Clostridia bacterium]|nr:DUF5752 family protein [Clostridia bacterium]
MTKEFSFARPIRLVRNGAFRAGSLSGLIKGLSAARPEALFYHLYRHYWEIEQAPEGGYNDFALWAGERLGEKVLAEKLASVQLAAIMQIEPARETMVRYCEEYLGGMTGIYRVPEGQELYFQEVTTVAIPTGKKAANLKELLEIWRVLEPASVFLHLVEARMKPVAGVQELAGWLFTAGEEELAKEVAQVSMYPYPLSIMQAYIAALLERRLGEDGNGKPGGLCPLSGPVNAG